MLWQLQVMIKFSSTEQLGTGSGDDAVIRALIAGTTGSNYILFGDADNSNAGQIRYQHSNNGTCNLQQMLQRRMRIDSSGNLTFSMEASSNYPTQQIKWSNDSTTTNGFYIAQHSDRLGRIWHEQGLSIVFGTNNTERMRIHHDGNVGIGTTSPARGPLHVHENSSNDCQIHLTNNDTGSTSSDGLTIFTDTDTSGIWSRENVDFQIATNGTERMRIDSSGRLLLGTTTAGEGTADDFTIGGTGHTGMTIRSGTTAECNIFFADGISGNARFRGMVRYFHNSDSLAFNTSAVERMRIDSSGKVGIGTTSPAGQLHLSSGTSGDCKLIIEADSDNNDESDNPQIEFRQDGGVGVSAIGHGLLSGQQNGLVLANGCFNWIYSFSYRNY